MALVTFVPPINPSPGTKHNPEINLFEAEFGDGYTQSMPAGLNHIRRVLDLNWDGLTLEQYQALDSFFTGQGGTIPFYFQPHGFASVLKWTCKEWSGSDGAPWRFSAKLREDFTTET